MGREKSPSRSLDRRLRSKNLVTLVALLVLVALFYGLAIVRLKTS